MDGYNVYPKEVENILETHEAVKESAVIGMPDEDFGSWSVFGTLSPSEQ